MEAALDELARAYPHVEFARIDLDQEPELGARYRVLALPTVVVLKDGLPVITLDGARPPADYGSALREVIPPTELDRLALD